MDDVDAATPCARLLTDRPTATGKQRRSGELDERTRKPEAVSRARRDLIADS
jgi:hypothetical protein